MFFKLSSHPFHICLGWDFTVYGDSTRRNIACSITCSLNPHLGGEGLKCGINFAAPNQTVWNTVPQLTENSNSLLSLLYKEKFKTVIVQRMASQRSGSSLLFFSHHIYSLSFFFMWASTVKYHLQNLINFNLGASTYPRMAWMLIMSCQYTISLSFSFWLCLKWNVFFLEKVTHSH